MEVHHHPDVREKKFKEYLLEGLMIFLAVTMGFFAESLRENINKNEKEHGYISSLVNDLKADTASINFAVTINKGKIRGLDSVLALSARDLNDPSARRSLYRYVGKYISEISAFDPNDATMKQLIISGGLQYIRHIHIADSIADYDQRVRSVGGAEAPYLKSIGDAMDATSEFLIFTIKRDSTTFADKVGTGEQFPLLTNDPQKKAIFFNKIYLEQGWTHNYVRYLEGTRFYTDRLIVLLKKEYDLE